MVQEFIDKDDAIRLAEKGQVFGFEWHFHELVKYNKYTDVGIIKSALIQLRGDMNKASSKEECIDLINNYIANLDNK